MLTVSKNEKEYSVRDEAPDKTTDYSMSVALLELEQCQRDMLSSGVQTEDVVEAMLGMVRQRLPGSIATVLWKDSVRLALRMSPAVRIPDGLTQTLATEVSGQIDAWINASSGRAVVRAEEVGGMDRLHHAAMAAGYPETRAVPVLSSSRKPLGLLLLQFAVVPVSAAAEILAEHLGFLIGATAERGLADGALQDAREQFGAVFNGGASAIALIDPASETVVDANDAFGALLGYDKEEIAGMSLSAVSVDGSSRIEVSDDAADADGGRPVFRRWFQRRDGSVFPAEYSTREFVSQGRSLLCLIGRDITEDFHAEGRLLLADKVFESMGEGAIIVDGRRRVISANRALLGMTGYSAEELIGKDASFLYDEADYWWQITQRSLDTGDAREHELYMRKKGGQLFPCLVSLSVAGHGRLVAPRLILVHKDVTQHRRTEHHLHFLANHDVLTRLPNRMQFYKRLDQAMAHAAEEQRSFAVLFIDLDRFKNINDTFGHSAGDLLLQLVADRLGRHIRKSDLLARLGGDEFTVLAEYMPDLQDVVALADHVMEALAQPFYIEGHELFVTASVGISVYPHDGRDTETLIKSADTAMYHAKSLGKNNYQFFLADMHSKPLEHLMLENALRHALERGEFMLYYQPKVDSATEHIFGMEALLRWNHPTLGIVTPGRFIPLAEETGLIREIGSWALREACRQNAIWRRAGYRSLVVSVNLSTVQLMSLDFAATVGGILADTGLDATCLELELTESAIMESPEQSSRTLQALRDMGVKISIDDFGTGYSSLNYLKRFPINTLKIDQSFVRDINIDANDAAITDAVISLAQSLKMDVIAEGVETAEQLRYLQRHGCNAYQGFLFSRPLPSAEFQQLLTVEPVR
jgi:diguanylate cyclase (GGDEF)-like protein/PAS domain S-box-containing protein